MSAQQLRCPCGHSWERPIPGPVPADVREVCPVCTASIQAASTPAGGSRPIGGQDSPRTELKPGDELAGFEILRPLNRGGMGVVYKARQISLNRLVALKVIAPERLGDDDYLKRFGREVRAAALLNHPNIVTVYATDLTGPWPYLAMEYVDGIDLYRLVKHSGPLGFLESCNYIRQAALGLQHAFERGLVHRDVKPHNLMVTPSPFDPAPANGPRRAPVVKILDMGLARVEAAEEGLEEGLTRAGEFVGTPDYAAPEQAEDPRLADVRADLYSLGAAWFYLLTAEVPFPGVSLMQKLKRQLTQPTPLVTDHCPDVPPALAATLEDFDFHFNPKLPTAQIRDLATCHFVELGESAILYGPVGVGKTHLAQALGHLACRRGHSVAFAKTHRLLAQLAGGHADHTFEARLRRLARVELLILDDFGLRGFTDQAGDDFFELVSERHKHGSMVLTSNRAPSDWYGLFPNPVVAEGVLDRLVNCAHHVLMEGRSYRPNKRPGTRPSSTSGGTTS